MAMINMRVWDVTGSRCQQVEAPDDVSLARLLVLLVEKMNLPINSPDGQIMSYKLHHKRTGRQLLDGQTLAEAGVINGDDLRLQPEITAGREAPAGAMGGTACSQAVLPRMSGEHSLTSKLCHTLRRVC